MPDLILDGNILGLQVHGGVSGYLTRLYVEFARLQVSAALILPRDVTYRGYGVDAVSTGAVAHRERLPAKVAQYMPALIGRRDAVFHSAYYRRPARPVARHVVTVHDFTYERFRSGAALWAHHSLKTAAIRAADAVICISEATLRDTLEFCPSVDPARLHVVGHGVDCTTFFPDTSGLAEHAIDGMEQTVLFVGQRVAYKRFDLAVGALKQMPHLRLGFAGPPPTANETALLEQHLPNRWVWFGRVDNALLRALYASAYAFIFPSDYEGFGLPVLEAMACGCPVLTSADAALREVGGSSALFAVEQQSEAYAAALEQIGSAETRALMVAGGHEIARRATWEKCARSTLDILYPGRRPG